MTDPMTQTFGGFMLTEEAPAIVAPPVKAPFAASSSWADSRCGEEDETTPQRLLRGRFLGEDDDCWEDLDLDLVGAPEAVEEVE